MPEVWKLCIKTTSLVCCFVLLRTANKLLLTASTDNKGAQDTFFTVSRIGVFVHCILCVAELCELALTHGAIFSLYNDDIDNITNLTSSRELQEHISDQTHVVKQLHLIWWWSYQTNMLHMRQIYTHHSKRIHTSMLMLYYHTAHIFSRNQSHISRLGQKIVGD